MKSFIFFVLFYLLSFGKNSISNIKSNDQFELSKRYLLKNISPLDGLPGSILASPSVWEPNYYFHWVRDAALVTSTLVDLYKDSSDPIEKNNLLNYLKNTAQFDSKIQKIPNLSGGLGEPKFMVTGLPFNDDWGRPQFDGPALRAISYITLANLLVKNNTEHELLSTLVDIILLDLKFIASNWVRDGFDIWEETYGQHFYTNMVQYRSLELGIQFLKNINLTADIPYFSNEALKIKYFLNHYFDENKNIIVPTLASGNNLGIKKSELDSSILLAFLHSKSLSLNNDFLLNTIENLRRSFSTKYKINQTTNIILMGRYPEDVYDGVGMQATGGNPWFITTHALAEFYCLLANGIKNQKLVQPTPGRVSFFRSIIDDSFTQQLENKKNIVDPHSISLISKQLKDQGKKYLLSITNFAINNGHLSEQINRDTGNQQGASDLSWSYSSYITAAKACGIN